MDLKKMIDQVVEFIGSNKDIKEQFDKEPVKVLEKVLGVDLPDNIVEPIIEGVKAKITVDAIGDVADALKGLFVKK